MLHNENITQEIRRVISDEEIMAKEDGVFIKKYTITPLTDSKSLFDKPVKVSDIKQGKIGNCYFLSALSTILEQDPDYIHQLMRVNDEGKIEVTLYDAHDKNKKYIYVLDPTIIKGKNSNQHTHPAIFLLEKAYAIHRHETERPTPGKREEKAINILKRNNLNVDASFSEFKKPNKMRTRNYLKEIISVYYLNYNAALTSGKAASAYASLLGVETSIKVVEDYKRDPFRFFLNDFLTNIIEYKRDPLDLSPQTKEVLTEIFGSMDSEEAKNLIDHIDPLTLSEAMVTLEVAYSVDAKQKDHKLSKATMLKSFFFNIEGLSDNTKAMLNLYFDAHIPKTRGMGLYTPKQEELYQLIKEKLLKGHLAVIGTVEYAGRNELAGVFANERYVKGLSGKHEYQVVSCYEKEGRKFLLLRNPWGVGVRDYSKKTKIIEGKRVEALSSFGKEQLSKGYWLGRLFSDSHNDIRYKQHGYFELELSDFKKINRIYFAESGNQSSEASKALQTFLAEMVQYRNGSNKTKKSPTLKLSLNQYTELAQTSSNKMDVLDMYAALALYFNVTGRSDLVKEAMFDLNRLVSEPKKWQLEDAFNYLFIRYQDLVPDLESLRPFQTPIHSSKLGY